MSQPAIQQWAGHYRNLGLGVVPLLPRTKRCIVDDWSTRIFDVKDFAPDANIGLRSIDGVVVVDDDFKTNDAVAIACMNHFLPPCGAVYGPTEEPSLQTAVLVFLGDRPPLFGRKRFGVRDLATHGFGLFGHVLLFGSSGVNCSFHAAPTFTVTV